MRRDPYDEIVQADVFLSLVPFELRVDERERLNTSKNVHRREIKVAERLVIMSRGQERWIQVKHVVAWTRRPYQLDRHPVFNGTWTWLL